MYARLGFAVAIHVDPEILLIDEVLAVGDMNFRKNAMNVCTKSCQENAPPLYLFLTIFTGFRRFAKGALFKQRPDSNDGRYR